MGCPCSSSSMARLMCLGFGVCPISVAAMAIAILETNASLVSLILGKIISGNRQVDHGGMRYVYLHGFASSPASRKAQAFAKAFEECEIALEIPALDSGDFEHLTIS